MSILGGDEVGKLKKFKFRLQVVLDMRENELEQRQMEMAKIVSALNAQKDKLQNIFLSQQKNTQELENLYNSGDIDVVQIENYRGYGIKLISDAKNQERIIQNTEMLLMRKQLEVLEAHKKVETLKKLKEKQEKEFHKEFLHSEMKELDDITSARFKIG